METALKAPRRCQRIIKTREWSQSSQLGVSMETSKNTFSNAQWLFWLNDSLCKFKTLWMAHQWLLLLGNLSLGCEKPCSWGCCIQSNSVAGSKSTPQTSEHNGKLTARKPLINVWQSQGPAQGWLSPVQSCQMAFNALSKVEISVVLIHRKGHNLHTWNEVKIKSLGLHCPPQGCLLFPHVSVHSVCSELARAHILAPSSFTMFPSYKEHTIQRATWGNRLLRVNSDYLS